MEQKSFAMLAPRVDGMIHRPAGSGQPGVSEGEDALRLKLLGLLRHQSAVSPEIWRAISAVRPTRPGSAAPQTTRAEKTVGLGLQLRALGAQFAPSRGRTLLVRINRIARRPEKPTGPAVRQDAIFLR